MSTVTAVSSVTTATTVSSITSAQREQMRQLAQRLLSQPVAARDVDIVERQLGRFPRGMVAVGARCVCGKPLAVITRPLLSDGTPFPTTCYLTSPEAVKALSHLEANGAMREYQAALAEDDKLAAQYRQAHELYRAFRHEVALIMGDAETHVAQVSAGGMPERVKCLHALAAQSLVMGQGVNPIGDMALEAAHAEFSPNVCRCSVAWRESTQAAKSEGSRAHE